MLASANSKDWIRISELLLGSAPEVEGKARVMLVPELILCVCFRILYSNRNTVQMRMPQRPMYDFKRALGDGHDLVCSLTVEKYQKEH